MKIFIGFSSPKSPWKLFANSIKLIEKRPYDHVYVRFPEPLYKKYMIFQASGTMVNMISPEIFLKVNFTIKEYEIEINEEQYGELWSFILTHLGIPYSLKQILGVLLMKIFHIKQPFTELDGEICSKLGSQICELLNIQIKEDLNSITPSDLDEILSNQQLKIINSPNILEDYNG